MSLSNGSVAAVSGAPEGSTALSTATIVSDPTTRYFLLKSFSSDNIGRSLQSSVWATSSRNSRVLAAAYGSSAYVVLFFSVNNSGRFSGFAVMTSAPGDDACAAVAGTVPVFCGPDGSPFPGSLFGVHWLVAEETFFRETEHIVNTFNENKPVKVGRDGQEIDLLAGRRLAMLMDQRQPQATRPDPLLLLGAVEVPGGEEAVADAVPPPVALPDAKPTSLSLAAHFSGSSLNAQEGVPVENPIPVALSEIGQENAAFSPEQRRTRSSVKSAAQRVEPYGNAPFQHSGVARVPTELQGPAGVKQNFHQKTSLTLTSPISNRIALLARFLKSGKEGVGESRIKGTALSNVSEARKAAHAEPPRADGIPELKGLSGSLLQAKDQSTGPPFSTIDMTKPLEVKWDFRWVRAQVNSNPLLSFFPVDLTAFESYEVYLEAYGRSVEKWDSAVRRLQRLPAELEMPPLNVFDCFAPPGTALGDVFVEQLLQLLADLKGPDEVVAYIRKLGLTNYTDT